MRGILKRMLVFLVVLYLGICAALFVFQRSLIYFPQPASSQDQSAVLTMQSGSERILVSTRPDSGPAALIYFGGNAEDVALDLPEFSAAFPHCALYLLHYRGFGGSTGHPTEKDLVADALQLFDLVSAQHRNVVVVGRSLGSGVAVHLAALRPVTRLVLITPFDSLQNVAAHHYPWVPVRLLLLDKYESWRYAPQVTAPTLIVAAEQDEVVPGKSTRRLRSRFRPGTVSFAEIPGAGHNTISEYPEYWNLLKHQ